MRQKQLFGFHWLTITLIITGIFLAGVIFLAVYIYNEAMEIKEQSMDHTISVILEQTAIKEVKDIDLFSGEESYHVLLGEDESGEEKIIFYPLAGKEKKIHSVSMDEVISKGSIYSDWKENCENCTFVEINPAIINEEMLWEIIYYDEYNRYVLDYVTMDDGTRVEQYRFTKDFK